MIEQRFEDCCNGCEDCKHCGRNKAMLINVIICDECKEEIEEAYDIDGEHICQSCMRKRLIKAEDL